MTPLRFATPVFIAASLLSYAIATPACVASQATPPSNAAAEELAAPWTTAEIESLVRELSAGSFDRREHATRRLCAIGPAAAEALRKAADSGDFEAATRARAVLEALDALLFSGLEVSLSVSRAGVRWNEPVDLTVTLRNESAYPARVPFRVAEPADDTDEARQVGRMLDLADYLVVRGPDGADVPLRTDDITADEAVMAAVERRAREEGLETIPPGQAVQVKLLSFNRGWSRYALLDAGAYAVSFAYAPPWDDEALIAAGAGRVTSAPATVEVTHPAPPTVSRAADEATVLLRQEGDTITASLINRGDLPIVVNGNFGPAAPFSAARWVVTSGDRAEELAVSPGNPALADFHADRLLTVPPGETVEIARADAAALLKAAAPDSGQGVSVQFRYVNLLDRRWQKLEHETLSRDPAVPAVLREPLPNRLLVGVLMSGVLAPTHP